MAKPIVLSAIREAVTPLALAGFTVSPRGVDIGKSATPKISKVPA